MTPSTAAAAWRSRRKGPGGFHRSGPAKPGAVSRSGRTVQGTGLFPGSRVRSSPGQSWAGIGRWNLRFSPTGVW